eukprot:GHRQ01036827.1.p1 GENE.GHRQ01036827.1~~GHRQ01036827.1.p1  ORF type:complete len:209 (-),score=46.50 GHRQ01036827.1:118-744(-)
MQLAVLVQIKHPSVIKVIEPLEETNGQMVFVTEPIYGSLANMITQFREVPSTPDDRAAAVLSPLEAKYGLYHVAETLQFLHQEARLAHCNLNPGSVIITKDGGWKLAGFEFAGGIADFGVQSGAAVAFEYTSAHPSPWEEYSAVSSCLAAASKLRLIWLRAASLCMLLRQLGCCCGGDGGVSNVQLLSRRSIPAAFTVMQTKCLLSPP